MTNENDREQAKLWLDRSKPYPENTTERLAERFADYRDYVVKYERERFARSCPICKGTGKIQHDCTLCGDSTYDHICNDYDEPCPYCSFIRYGEASNDKNITGVDIINNAIESIQKGPNISLELLKDMHDQLFDARRKVTIASDAITTCGLSSIKQDGLVRILEQARAILSNIIEGKSNV